MLRKAVPVVLPPLILLALMVFGQGSATKNLSIVVSGAAASPVLCPNIGQTGNAANCVQPPVLAFGKQGTSTASMAIAISVNNCSTPDVSGCTGSGSLTLSATPFVISGTNAADFTFAFGTCSPNLAISSGGNCQPTITFTPTASSGTAETATLTVSFSGVASQTMSLTGTSQGSVTSVSACGALSANTNYQLAANVTASGTCFTLGGSNIDFNINGFTVVYGNAANSSLVGGFFNSVGNVNNVVVHNGTINEGAGPNTGKDSVGDGPGMFICANRGAANAGGWQMFNVTGAIKAEAAKVVFVEDDGNSARPQMHDIVFTDSDPANNCSIIGCRSNDQYYALVWSDNRTGAGVDFYNISGTGTPQGGVVSFSPSSTFNNNNISPGNTSHTVTNGFAEQMWGSNQVAQNNLIQGTGPNGSCVSCRGIQSGSAGSNTSTGNTIQNNVLHTYNLNNNLEYGGCQIDGSFGMQINTAGSSQQTASTLFQNNKVYTNSGVCPAFGFSWSGGNTPASNTKNNLFSCALITGHTANGPCAGIRLDANQWNPHVAAVVGTGDTYLGDTSSIYIWFDGTPTWVCNQCTFGKGPNPIAGWVMLDYDGAAGGMTQSSDPMFLVDPTFTGGASAGSNNLAAWAGNNTGLSFSYTIQWTYTVTVQQSSNSAPINGASVTMTDVNNTVECSGTTNSSGIFSCVVNDTKYNAASGSYTTPSFNPFALQITDAALGCTPYNQSGKVITSTTTETKQLPGC